MKYRKKPVVIDAIQYIGQNKDEVIKFTNGLASHNPKNRHSRCSFDHAGDL